jgi:hypothetical protein
VRKEGFWVKWEEEEEELGLGFFSGVWFGERMGMEGAVATSKVLECRDPVETLVHTIDGLYTVRDTFFPLDPTIKKARLHHLMREVLTVLNEISAGD